ncbi:uncharacterized protein M6B38_418250 [Iris pallida]|uniref:Reverse transcriptase zinc-binding domain-containing protein n=1 Tax=Iris pallida TaxID=29817 RepID=A0AAX6FIT6_IRIPA|nr:uncharacterized protein M6B38_418250 [Iris pallida]
MTASGWRETRTRLPIYPILRLIFYNNISKKWSILLWCVIREKIPTDDVLICISFFIASRCWCCAVPACESIQHLFWDNNSDRKIWGAIERTYGGTDLKSFIQMDHATGGTHVVTNQMVAEIAATTSVIWKNRKKYDMRVRLSPLRR